MALGRNGRIAAAVGIAGAAALAAFVVAPGTFGGFTSESTNPNNAVQAGTLTMSNSVDKAAIISEQRNPGSQNLKPGDSVVNYVTIGNNGSLDATMKVTVDTAAAPTGTGADDIATEMRLEIIDVGDDGKLGGTDDRAVTGSDDRLRAIDNRTYDVPRTGEPWQAGETHTYAIRVTFVNSNGDQNKYQDESTSFELIWRGTQTGGVTVVPSASQSG